MRDIKMRNYEEYFDTRAVYLGLPPRGLHQTDLELDVHYREVQQYIRAKQESPETPIKILGKEYRIGTIYLAGPRRSHLTVLLHQVAEELENWQI